MPTLIAGPGRNLFHEEVTSGCGQDETFKGGYAFGCGLYPLLKSIQPDCVDLAAPLHVLKTMYHYFVGTGLPYLGLSSDSCDLKGRPPH